MAQAAIAVQKQKGPVPKFMVTPGGAYTRKIATWNKEKKTFEYHTVEEKESFILSFPRGHSIRIRTRAEVERLVGDPENIELINLDTSDVEGVINRPIKKKGE